MKIKVKIKCLFNGKLPPKTAFCGFRAVLIFWLGNQTRVNYAMAVKKIIYYSCRSPMIYLLILTEIKKFNISSMIKCI